MLRALKQKGALPMDKKKPPLVSIGMPVYNGARYIDATLSSLVKQTVTDLHITICDDGSTDDTMAICRRYASNDRRISLSRNSQRLGGAKNFNQTFLQSAGQYFMWAAQDDLFHPTYIQRCLAKLEQSPRAVMALSEIVLIDETGNKVQSARPIDGINIDTAGMNVVERLREVFRRTGWWAIYGLIRPEILRKTQLYRSEFAGDVLLIVELLLHGEIVKVADPLFYYRCRTKQPFTIEHNQKSIDHTKKASPTAYTDLMHQIIHCVLAFDLDPATKKQIIVTLINTLLNENHPLRDNIVHENLADLVAIALSCNTLHSSVLQLLDARCGNSVRANQSTNADRIG